MKKVAFGEGLVLSPFKMISINHEKVFLFIIEPAILKPFNEKILITSPSYRHVYISMDTFLLKLSSVGLKIFKPDAINELLPKISFRKVTIKDTAYRYVDQDFSGVVIPIETTYQHEIRQGEVASGDCEYDGFFDYHYHEKKFPVVNQNDEMRMVSFPSDGKYVDNDLPNRIMENQKYLVYSKFN